MELGRRAYGKIERMTVTAQAPMETLMEEVEETVFLGTMQGDHAIILKVVESPNELKITAPPGSKVPLLAGALGRVFLTQIDEAKVKEIIQKKGLRKYTADSVTDPEKFFKEVQETKKRGYSIDTDEYIPGVTAVASPILTTFLPPAAIWVVGFSPSFHDKKMEKAIIEIKKAASAISSLLKDRS